MRCKLDRLDLTYELTFKHPAFEVAQAPAAILRAFHSHINPRFPLTPADMYSSGGPRLADVVVGITLLRGAVNLSLRSDRFMARFEQFKTENDFKIAEDCLSLGQDALKQALSNTDWAHTAYRTSSWLICDDAAKEVERLLAAIAQPVLPIDGSVLNAEVRYNLAAELANPSQKWNIQFQVERSLIPSASLFVMFSVTFSDFVEGSGHQSLSEQVAFCRRAYVNLLTQIGLTPSDATLAQG
ncbi:MAG: hypothetical protein ACT4P2_15665 [Pseudomonadota bacterium]